MFIVNFIGITGFPNLQADDILRKSESLGKAGAVAQSGPDIGITGLSLLQCIAMEIGKMYSSY